MSLESVAQRVAARVYFDELAAARVLNHSGVECYVMAFRAMDETYLRAFEADRPAVWPQSKTIGNIRK